MAEERQLDAVYAARAPRRSRGPTTTGPRATTARWRGSATGTRRSAWRSLARHLPRGAGPVLDAGAGTGLIGEWLEILGFPEAEALDVSEGMLAVAGRKAVYARLHRAALGQPLPFADGAFAAAVSAGVFTTGHVGAEGLDELLRVVRPGGVLVLTVKDSSGRRGSPRGSRSWPARGGCGCWR